MKTRLLPILPLLLSLIPLLFISSCSYPDPPPYINCDVQSLVDAINNANSDPGVTEIELFPGCEYIVDQNYSGSTIPVGAHTALPLITTEVHIMGNNAVITRPDEDQQSDHYRFFAVEDNGKLVLSDLILRNGWISTYGASDFRFNSGGAIFNYGLLEMNNVTFEENEAYSGGAVYNYADAAATIASSEFNNNQGKGAGGAISNVGVVEIRDSSFEGNSSKSTNTADGRGGAIRNFAEIVISGSYFHDNESRCYGGAIYNDGEAASLRIDASSFYFNRSTICGASVIANEEGNTEINNSTIFGNRSSSSYLNAVSNLGGSLEISYSTVVNNFGPGGMVSSDNSNVTIKNSIFSSYASGDNCEFPGAINTVGVNMSSDSSCDGFTEVDDLKLGPFTDNGGSTYTIALEPDSPAVNRAEGDCPAADQRGVDRPYSFSCDLGAYEAEEVEKCTVEYLVGLINEANSDPDLTRIILEPNCTYMVDQAYGGEHNGLPEIDTEVFLLGNGATITRPEPSQQPEEYRLIKVGYHGNLTVNNVVFVNGYVPGSHILSSRLYGGAIMNIGDLTIMNSTFIGNTATSGGAVSSSNIGKLMITGTTFQDNIGTVSGGALRCIGSQKAEIEGCVFIGNQVTGSFQSSNAGGAIINAKEMEIRNSYFEGNSAYQTGGAIFNVNKFANLTIINTTFTGNASKYGSVFHNDGNSLSLINCTLSNNPSSGPVYHPIYEESGLLNISYSTITDHYAYGVIGLSPYYDNSEISVTNSILADNHPRDCDRSVPMTVYGNNLDTRGDCLDFSIYANPLLEPLADNGGGVMTHALTISSPALNAASGEYPPTDQRGVLRPQGSASDLGAYEYDGPQPTPSPTPEIDSCMFEAIRNTNCRKSTCPEAEFIASLPMGEFALLIGMNTQGTYGFFELPGGEECWMLLSLLTRGDTAACNPIVAIPPPCPTPTPKTSGPGAAACRADMNQAACEAAGGVWYTQVFPPKCICP